MINDLQNGREPDLTVLRHRLQAAMVKKLAMMRLSKEFHHNDSKINPITDHMLWAALFLEDHEAMATLASILLTEAHDRYEARRGAMDAPALAPDMKNVLTKNAEKLRALCSDKKLNDLLRQKIQKATIFKELT